MQTATHNNTPITAGPNAPTTATCPECGGTVTLRKRKRMDGQTTYGSSKGTAWRFGKAKSHFYRHTSTDPNDDCPRRYRPT
jgi:ssDNA-binding Zn-finger/Zn-ribbon topoisomerase 1